MKDSLQVIKKRKIKGEVIKKDGKLYYLEEEMAEEKPLEEIFEPFIDDFCDITISNKDESDSIEVEE